MLTFNYKQVKIFSFHTKPSYYLIKLLTNFAGVYMVVHDRVIANNLVFNGSLAACKHSTECIKLKMCVYLNKVVRVQIFPHIQKKRTK